jgi:predicted acylesterase/phospholipase RssA
MHRGPTLLLNNPMDTSDRQANSLLAWIAAPPAVSLVPRSIHSVAAASTPDVVIDVPRDACLFYEFYRAEELITLGRECAERSLGRQSPA